jgi:hypothetical protein
MKFHFSILIFLFLVSQAISDTSVSVKVKKINGSIKLFRKGIQLKTHEGMQVLQKDKVIINHGANLILATYPSNKSIVLTEGTTKIFIHQPEYITLSSGNKLKIPVAYVGVGKAKRKTKTVGFTVKKIFNCSFQFLKNYQYVE